MRQLSRYRLCPARPGTWALCPVLLGLAVSLGSSFLGCHDESPPRLPAGQKPGEGEGEGEGEHDLGADAGDAAGLAPEDLGPQPEAGRKAGYLEPCAQNVDCASGWCVAYAGGHVCTRPCTEECDRGWLCRVVGNQGSDVVSLCMPPDDRLCLPCSKPDDCEGGLCVRLDPGDVRLHCTQPCLEGSSCRQGFRCSSLEVGGETFDGYCLPATGTCTCTAANEGMDRLCSATSEHGTCLGREYCRAEQGWEGCDAPLPMAEVCNQRDDDCNGFADDVAGLGAPCTREALLSDGPHACTGLLVCAAGQPEPHCTAPEPVAELCNLRDDDCDGAVDEAFPELGEPCTAGVGACLRAGAVVCDELTGATRCLATAGEPGEERCNHQDDDCDGEVDEDFREPGGGRYVVLEHCGGCGQSCAGLIPDGTARCDGSSPVPACTVDSCDPGFYQAGPALCLPFEDPSCQPCVADASCGMPGNRCLELDGVRACGRDCAAGNAYGTEPGWCPAGFSCIGFPELGEGVLQCVPLSRSCSCLDADDDGTARSCLAVSEQGACAGLQLCTPGAGWSPCSAPPPGPEQCNGLDDDCDGQVDEEVVPPEEPCHRASELGDCPGSWRCAGRDGWSCAAAEPAAESCNYQDDDCDGLTDEGFVDEASGLYVHPEHCGRCGISCAGAVPYASETACAVEDGAAACVALQCEPDYFVPPETSRICLPRAGGFDCSPCLADEHCSTLADGRCEGLAEGEGRFCTRSCSLDEDCPAGFGCNAQQRCHPSSGSCTCLPERAGVSRLCRWENEQGTCLGRELCDPLLGWSDCSAHLPAAEECNGIDDDCDFLVDEELLPPDGPLCTVAGQWGVCTGPWSCAGEAGWQCGAAIPAAEQCNGRDDDCDGTTDEGFRNPQTGLYDSVDHCGVCGYSCTGRIPHAAALRCDVAGGLPTCAVVSCEPGFFRAGDLACVPVTSNRCVPCIDDGSCPVDGDRCLELDGARVCGQDCRAGNLHGLAAGVCPQGYTCRGFGVEVRQCVPISGSCTCLAEHAGSSRLCTVANELGRCTGFATCDPERSWSGCSAPPPARESCNGRDDDCDGMIDEGFAGLNQPCLAGEGACLRAGVMRCTDDGAATICGAQPGAAQPEACNYQDDDCDGATDEDYKDPLTGLYVGQEHCGLCNASCARAILFATATECRVVGASALCLATACEPGYLLSQNGRVCVPPSGVGDCSPCAEDIDCMSMAGGRCERFPEGRFCTKGCGGEAGGCSPGYDCVAGRCWPVSRSCTCLLGNAGEMRVCWSSNAAGTCVGTQTCAPERSPGWQPCTAPVPAVETCDGQDNDCNGLTDEGVVHPDGPACLRRNELGACPGVWLCRGIERWSCSAAEPVVESCNGKDDDCDGVVDEDFPALLVPCFAGEGACRVAGVARCTPDGRGTECTARAGQPTPELCNGVDDDCDRRVDEDFPDLFTPCSAGQGVCLRQGVRVCTQDGRGTECDARPGQAGVESCNGLDDDCNGLIDDGYPGLGMPCSAGIGACQRPGVLVCAAGGQGTVCNAVTGEPREERCNGVDDDCDGGVDEDFGNLARACSVGVGACLRQGVQVCTDDGLGTKCDAMPGMAGEESCNGLDDDCDGRIDEDFADLFTPCIVGQGACQNAGVRVCTLDGHATECDAEPRPAGEEICDSLDNDCDGWTDEEFDGLAAPCMVGDGACRRVGIVRCAADHQGTECSVQPGQPVAERCNGIDDDCDQQTDEEAIWAAKGQPCTAGVGACARSGIHVCNQDDPAGPTVCTAQAGAAGQERCNGVDDDCDGQVDDPPFVDVQRCANQRGVCQGSIRTCGGVRGWLECNSSNYPADYESTETLCDGRDNDCDGSVDEDLVGPPCQLQAGVCAGSRRSCAAGGWAPCGPAQYGVEYEAAESSCDLLDNDCDGATDEGWLNAGKYDQDRACGNCFTDCTVIYARPNAFGRCNAAPATPVCEMRCNVGYFDMNRVPGDGCELGLDLQAIYVSAADPQADDLAGCGRGPVGTGGGHRPCRTIARGLTEAMALGRSRVLVADGLYEETVTLRNGVSLLGGYRADTWERRLASTMTIVRGNSANLHKKTIVGQGIGQATVLQGFVIYGQSNYSPGGNTYALWLRDCTAALALRDNVVYGGFAAAGAAGSSGDDGLDGVAGRAGEDTITTSTFALATCNDQDGTPGNQGEAGDGGARTCAGADDVGGGAGAGAACPSGNDLQPSGQDGQPAQGGGAAGAGGAGGHDRVSNNCGTFGTGGFSATGSAGGDGGDGTNGGQGSGCPPAANRGAVVGSEWAGSGGSAGTVGTNGDGGGGGGAGGGADVTIDCNGVDDCLGGSGGGGGSGACAGTGGGGGGAGGGAFAFFVAFTAPSASLPVLEGNRVTRGAGGAGGNGGLGGAGGVGGDGGPGGNVSGQWAFAMGPGGRGGQGGDGGHGAGGGGGCGGVSYGIFVFNHSVATGYDRSNTFAGGGSGGAGGQGGSSLGASGGAGGAGDAADWRF